MDLVATGGRVTLQRRDAGPQDVGKRPRDLTDGLLLRIHRGEQTIGFWQPEAIVQQGDVLLIVSPNERRDA